MNRPWLPGKRSASDAGAPSAAPQTSRRRSVAGARGRLLR